MKDLQTGAILLHNCTKDGVYKWPTNSSTPIIVFSNVKATHYDWHHRLGHPSESILRHLVSNYKLYLTSTLLLSFHCKDCYCNKSHKLPFSQSTLVSFTPLQIIFYDVWASPILSTDNFKYYVIFVDHFTHYIWLYPLKHKSNVSLVFLASKPLLRISLNGKSLHSTRIMKVNTLVCLPS